MKHRLSFLFILCIPFIGCCNFTENEKNEFWNINIDVNQFKEFKSIGIWVYKNIKQVRDIDNYGQEEKFVEPQKVIDNGKGDCEDCCGVTISIIYKKYNIKSNFVVIKKDNGNCHAIIELNNIYYESNLLLVNYDFVIIDTIKFDNIPYFFSLFK